MATATNGIIEKLAKLIAHEESAREIGSLQEAEAFADKIQQLLSQHKLSLSDVEGKKEEAEGLSYTVVRPSEWMEDKVRAQVWERQQSVVSWLFHLANGIARSNDCVVVLYGRSNIFQFVGVKSDREPVVELFRYMARLAWELSTKAQQEAKDSLRAEVGWSGSAADVNAASRQYRTGWLQGFSDAVVKRLYAQRRSMMDEAKATSNETALVLVDRRQDMLTTYLASLGKGRAKMSGGQIHAGGYAAGKATGSRVALTSKSLK
jgi:hypothetical protein